MREACLPLGALLLLSWTLLVTMEPQQQGPGDEVVEVPGGEGLKTSFSCHSRVQGYYADIETGCRLYHLCDDSGRQFTHACPNLTLFQQRMMICDHWYMVNCSASIVDYAANLLLGRRDQPFLKPEDHLHQQYLQYQQRQRVPLPVEFPYNNEREEDEGSQETRSVAPQTRGQESKASSTSNKRKSSVNSSKTLSFSISSLPSEERNYNRDRVKNRRRPVNSSRVNALAQAVGSNNTASKVLENSEPVTHESDSTTSFPASETFSSGHNIQLRYKNGRYSPEVTKTQTGTSKSPSPATYLTRNQDSSQIKPTRQFETTSPRPISNFDAFGVYKGQTSDQYQFQQQYQKTQQFETPSPDAKSNFDSSGVQRNQGFDQVQQAYGAISQSGTSSSRTTLNFQNAGVKPVNEAPYFAKTNSLSTTESSIKYGNNPYLQKFYRSSPIVSPIVVRTTTSLPPVFNIEEEDEDEHSENRIEIILQDPRRMFFIPDSDIDLNNSLNTKNATILVIPLPHRHGAMRFRSNERFFEGRNPQCPRCHPAFLLPGQCQPCVLIK